MNAAAKSRLGNKVSRIFGNYMDYSFLAGTHAYSDGKPNKSDADVVVVLQSSIQKARPHERETMCQRFTDAYLEVHSQINAKPDFLFPGELVTTLQVEDALRGRGLEVLDEGLSITPIYSDSQWDQDSELTYRALRSMSAFNGGQFLAGNERAFNKNREIAWGEIAKYLLCGKEYVRIESMLDDIVAGGKPYLGIAQTYEPGFSIIEGRYLEEVFSSLAKSKYIQEISYSLCKVNKKKLRAWEISRIDHIMAGEWRGSDIFNTKRRRDYVKQSM